MKQTIRRSTTVLILLSLVLLYAHCSKTKKVVDPPVLTQITPSNGFIGDPITLKGSNLQNTDQITFNGVASKLVQVSSTQVVSVIPPGAGVGVNNIVVHSNGGSSNQLQFEVFKEPVHPDALPPALTSVIPSSTYSDYPVLIYGANLSEVVKLTFNDKDAAIYTNNQNVVTATIPKDLPAGKVTVKLITKKGTSTINFQTLGPSAAAPGVNFSIITVPPPGYLPSISNQWSCGLYSEVLPSPVPNFHYFVDLSSDDGTGNYNITGIYSYNFNKAENYNNSNYIQIINHSKKDTLVGMFSSKFNNPCVLNMVFISSKDGKVSQCTFDIRSNTPDIACEE